jgi:membrane associated rhomboid family serine protease
MAYHDRGYARRSIFGSGNSALITLIAIHLILFVIFAFIQAMYTLKSANGAEGREAFDAGFLSLFTLPADLHKLGGRPWALLSYMFIQVDFWRVFANMLWLWTFGYILEDLTGDRKIFPVFLYGGLIGGIGFVGAYQLLPALKAGLPYAVNLGASSGILAIAIAATYIAPGYRIFPMLAGGIPLWIITALYLLIDLGTLSLGSTGIYVAHLAGAATGWLYMYSFRQGRDWGEWMNNFWDWLTNLFNPDRPKKKRVIREELFYKATTRPFKKTPNVTEQRIDEILDKINQIGYESLTEEEKDLLKRASERDA